MVFPALLRALPQILLPGIRAVLWQSLAITVAIFALIGAGVWLGLRLLLTRTGWLDADGFAGAALAVAIALVIGWLLFRAVAIAIVGLYADRIVAVVEQTDYPTRHAQAAAVPFATGMRIALRSAGRAVGWNLAVLPLYVALLVTGVGAPILFLVLNAYLLGRDLAELIEGRHPGLAAFTAGQRWQLGLVSALLFLPPVVNLLAPIWSVAMAAHMFHAPRKT
ncbi:MULTISPECIES: EI24 domain-containing protein [unclassified Sphingobium]|uniref:EI24 domain-containing protein n=1 Tax=unclassified Sphingobium TaxID=2611147 RepID=UPI0022249D94|nr:MULTISPECIES: EI24 domain-containing protein [unclassified Sphingobium]MCW2383247.1 uncharacterized protein involved in cysteine biosynthesis [Sphingobium sp. B2D3B]MCW2399778.1 uncharacterized protein involved in cysteine biosynthesis [Sphingobium sp. B2D3C]